MLNFLFGKRKPAIDSKVAKEAIVVDVRTPAEFAAGHASAARNIPLNLLAQKLSSLPKNKPIITCCASGIRSATAKKILLQNGFTEVYDVGSWTSL